VQILYWDVPLRTGPVVLSPSAAFTTDADGHGGNALVAFPDGAAVVATPGKRAEVDEDEAVLADEQAAMSNVDKTTATATVVLRLRLISTGARSCSETAWDPLRIDSALRA